MRFRAVGMVVALALAMGLSACAPGKFKTYRGPAVTRIVVMKGERTMYLLHGTRALKKYHIDLGFSPVGAKQYEGDGKTPEGSFIINRRNPNSEFHLSLGISYPDINAVQVAREAGRSPGGDIFIHGGPRRGDPKKPDWTWGCISVSDKEIETIYAMVRDGTPVDIFP